VLVFSLVVSSCSAAGRCPDQSKNKKKKNSVVFMLKNAALLATSLAGFLAMKHAFKNEEVDWWWLVCGGACLIGSLPSLFADADFSPDDVTYVIVEDDECYWEQCPWCYEYYDIRYLLHNSCACCWDGESIVLQPIIVHQEPQTANVQSSDKDDEDDGESLDPEESSSSFSLSSESSIPEKPFSSGLVDFWEGGLDW